MLLFVLKTSYIKKGKLVSTLCCVRINNYWLVFTIQGNNAMY
jgi:hypothetical protein